MKKRNNIPKVDLSKYNSADRLDSNVELIIVNGLIAFDCNISKVSKHFSINEDIVNGLFIKYYSHICKIVAINARNDKTEETLDNIVEMYYNHCKEIKQSIDANPATKILSERLVGNLNKICDRILETKDMNNKQFDNTVNRLNDQIVKFKQLAVLESGKVEDAQDYLDNQKSVVERILEYKEDYSYNDGKHIQVLDIESGQAEIYPSIQSLVKHLGLSSGSHISTILKSGNLYKGKFKITETDDQPTVFD